MKIFVKNTSSGLIPMNDQDYENKRKLKIGEVYQVSVKLARNYRFHKKYFALINLAWEYLNEKQTEMFKTMDVFRKTIEVASGHCERIYSIRKKEWFDIPKSIAFDKMSEDEFSELYSSVLDTLLKVVFFDMDEKQVERELLNFM